jgi:hypothetical protein
MAVTTQQPTQVTSSCNLSPVRQVSSVRRKDDFFTSATSVRCRTLPGILLTCQNEFRDIFPYSSVPTKSTISCLVNRFQAIQQTLHWVASNMTKEVNACVWKRWTFPALNMILFFFYHLNIVYVLKNRTCVRSRNACLADFVTEIKVIYDAGHTNWSDIEFYVANKYFVFKNEEVFD